MLLIDFLDKGVRDFPNRLALRDGDRHWTYAQMGALVDRIAGALVASGLKPGAKVAVYSPNHGLAFAVQYGLIRAGCVWVPVSSRNAGSATAEALAEFEVEWLFFHSSLSDAVRPIAAQVPSLRGSICLDTALDFAKDLDNWIQACAMPAQFPARTPADTVALLTTSGTTGRPKGIVVSNRAFATMINGMDILFPNADDHVHLVVAPLSHAAGIYASTLLAHGATNILLHSPDPLCIMEAIERHRITTVFLPPTLIYMLLAHPKLREFDFSSLRSMVYGAAPMSVAKLREAASVFGPVLVQGYGQSEALMICTVLTAQDHKEALGDPALEHRLQSAGRESPVVRLEIMDDDGKLLGPDERGEIVVRGDIVMDGYYRNPEATAQASVFGWHHTGDVGFRDRDGYVYIVDRKKDMIISGGFNIFPAEVEQVMLANPDVKDCAVVGVPHPKWGEAVLATIELKPGAQFDEAGMLAWCKDRLGSVKAPKAIKVVEVLPRSAVGKVLRREIRAPYWAAEGKQV